MSAPVHILATCRKPELLGGTLLVFDTLRIGFPTAKVTVHLNNHACSKQITAKADEIGCHFVWVDTIHHEWIEKLFLDEAEPFWILDTDVVLWSSVEDWDMSECFLSGTYTPRFHDPFTKCDTQSRLHTCLMYFDPIKIMSKVTDRLARHVETPFNPCVNLIHPVMIPTQDRTFFFDTCALLHQAIGGTAFKDDQLKCFEHLHCGTWSDLIESVFPRMRKIHDSIFADPQSARGLRDVQNEFYAQHAI